jgi:integrase
MADIEKIWGIIQRNAGTRRSEMVPILRQHLTADVELRTNVYARALVGWTEGASVTVQSARELEANIIRSFQKGFPKSRKTCSSWLSLLNQLRKEFARQGVELPETQLMDDFPLESSPFANSETDAAKYVDHWRAALFEWISRASPETPRADWTATIVLSAIVFGLLLDRAKILALLEQLDSCTAPELIDDYGTYSFKLPYRGLGFHHLQRWVIDPVTEMLIWRLPPDGQSLKPSALDKNVREILHTCQVPNKYLPKKVTDVIHASQAWWSQKASRFDVNVGSRRICSHALEPRTWYRFHGLVLEDSIRNMRTAKLQEQDDDLDFPVEALLDEYAWLREVLQNFDSQEPSEIDSKCAGIAAGLPENDIGRVYLGWLRRMLLGKDKQGNPLSVSVTQSLFWVTTLRLLDLIQDADPTKMTLEETEDLYADLVTDYFPEVPTRDLVRGLREFHHYLNREHGLPPIKDEAAVFGDDSALRPVDARLPSFDEYFLAHEWLEKKLGKQRGNAITPDDIQIARIVMSLAFRCGLRRMEIFGLRLRDLHFHHRLKLLIRPYSRRTLKTSSSRRTCPGYVLLGAMEMGLLREWFTKRVADETNRGSGSEENPYLFKQFAGANYRSWIDRMTKLIYSALRGVIQAGDGGENKDLVLHHLRHGFATWLNLALRAPEHPAVLAHFKGLPRTLQYLESGRKLRKRLLIEARGPTRRYAFAVARLLGHASPATSAGHYIHTADLILGAFSWEAWQDFEPKGTLVAASGLSASAYYDNLNLAGLMGVMKACREKYRMSSRLEPSALAEVSQQKAVIGRPRKVPAREHEKWLRFDAIIEVLNLATTGKKSAEQIRLLLALPVDQVQSILDKAGRHGKIIGLPIKEGRLVEFPLMIKRPDQERLDEIEKRFAILALSDPGLLGEGLEIHMENYNNKRKDVVFRGVEHLGMAKRYIKFLNRLGYTPSEFQWVVHRRPEESDDLPDWVNKLGKRWRPEKIRKVSHGQGVEKAASFREWLGLQPLEATGGGMSAIFLKAIYLGILGAGLI